MAVSHEMSVLSNALPGPLIECTAVFEWSTGPHSRVNVVIQDNKQTVKTQIPVSFLSILAEESSSTFAVDYNSSIVCEPSSNYFYLTASEYNGYNFFLKGSRSDLALLYKEVEEDIRSHFNRDKERDSLLEKIGVAAS